MDFEWLTQSKATETRVCRNQHRESFLRKTDGLAITLQDGSPFKQIKYFLRLDLSCIMFGHFFSTAEQVMSQFDSEFNPFSKLIDHCV